MTADDGGGEDGNGRTSGRGERRSGSVSISARATVRTRGYALSEYAPRWWADAAREARAAARAAAAEDPPPAELSGAVRRQVVFAVCALESWAFEWVRDDALGDAHAATALFWEKRRLGLDERLKCVASELHARGELDAKPGFGESAAWDDLKDPLLRARNGLVHAGASFPRGDVPPDAEEGRPKPQHLSALAPARPLEIVRGVAELLTGFADDEPPDWMTVPAGSD